MKTYSEKISDIRAFLKSHSAEHINSIEVRCPVGHTQETWRVKGKEIILRIAVDGSWEAFAPPVKFQDEKAIIAIERGLRGARPDLDIIDDIGYLGRAFLNKIEELPGCSDPECTQDICKSKSNLKAEIEKLIGIKKEKKEVV